MPFENNVGKGENASCLYIHNLVMAFFAQCIKELHLLFAKLQI